MVKNFLTQIVVLSPGRVSENPGIRVLGVCLICKTSTKPFLVSGGGKYALEELGFWLPVVSFNYGRSQRPELLLHTLPIRKSFFNKSILSYQSAFLQGEDSMLKDGNTTLFWLDRWFEGKSSQWHMAIPFLCKVEIFQYN